MIIKDSQYLTSLVDINALGESTRKEFAFMGRSNVGKSPLINALTNRKNLARTSSNPGKTQTLNFYLINNDFYFVDFPGYGYAKTSKEKKASFGKMIDHYLQNGKNLKALFLLVDYKVGPTKDDILMYQYLSSLGYVPYVVLTKSDKLKQSELVKNKKETLRLLDAKEEQLIITSSNNKKGMNQILDIIEKCLGIED